MFKYIFNFSRSGKTMLIHVLNFTDPHIYAVHTTERLTAIRHYYKHHLLKSVGLLCNINTSNNFRYIT